MTSDWHSGVVLTVRPRGWDDPAVGRLAGWLTGEARGAETTALFDGLCRRLVEAGMPIWRSVILFATLHPLHPGQNLFWLADEGVSLIRRGHDFESTPIMATSPYRESLDRNADVGYRLDLGGTPRIPILAELQAEGVTEFLSLLIPFTYGTPPGITFATKAPGGFTDDQVALLRALPPLLAGPLEVRAQRLTATAIVDTYLGRRAGSEVMQGAIQRGDVRRVRCAIVLTDLRGFTAKTERWPADVLLDVLDRHFEAVADAVHAHAGEIIKFMGDGVLAIFPIEAERSADDACRAAVQAMLEAREAMARINEARAASGEEAVEFGAGLHVGDVAYGNIGGRDRLDFTVIGPAVNIASRVQDLCKTLGRPILMTADVAGRLEGPLVELGSHEIRGSDVHVEIFAPGSADDSA